MQADLAVLFTAGYIQANVYTASPTASIPMSAGFKRILVFILALFAASASAGGSDLSAFNAAVEKAESHNRVAIGYLRTGNIDLASLEFDRLRDAWSDLQRRFASKRPQVFDGNQQYIVVMTDIATRLITADMLLKSGRPDGARETLQAIRTDLYGLRKSAGIVTLADCILDANGAMDALMVYNDRALDWSKPDIASGIADKATRYGTALTRCDGIAEGTTRQSPEFRRLIDGAKASLALIPKAITDRDTGLLHRVLIELRSFDNLLAFRFG